MIYLFLMFYSLICFVSREMIPLSLMINGYLYIIVMYFVFPYVVAWYIKKTKKNIYYCNKIKKNIYITDALIVKGGLSIYLPINKEAVYAISEKSFKHLTNEELDFLIFHEKAHIIYRDQINNMISFFTVIYVNPIILTFISSLEFVKKYIVIYLIFAVVFYLFLFVLHFYRTRLKEMRADYYASVNTSISTGMSTLQKLSGIYELREKTFNALATHPSVSSRIDYLNKN